MKRALPLWLAAVVPATLAGHGLAYALTGRSAADGHHVWMAPALECSLSVLFALCTALAVSTLLESGFLVHTDAERSCFALWQRLAPVQLLLFALMERSEGAHVGITGIAMQMLTALCAAYVVSLFCKLLAHVAEFVQAGRYYKERLQQRAASVLSRRPLPIAYALAVRAGNSRFQRPPPQL